MDTRREFIKKAAWLSGGAGLLSALPPSIQRALAIEPNAGSTWLDAEHIVILMQENRSFDHCFGTLQGVRGFNDPRAISLPGKHKVWLQKNAEGETYAPFRLNMKDSKATWVGSLPHSWTNQVDARNHGKYDKWLDVKRSGDKAYAHLPLTMGYYNREDIPFYYAMADAFTVCDQNFCSSLTGTTPNRLFLWTGTVREEQHEGSHAKVRNEDVDYDVPAHWTTFPERLEDHGVSWKIYQNELSVDLGFTGEQDPWLANFTDNPLEWFSQYQVRFSAAYMRYLPKKIAVLTEEINALANTISSLVAGSPALLKAEKELKDKQAALLIAREEEEKYTPENYAKLSQREKNLHEKAFCTNSKDAAYHELETLRYQDEHNEREMQVPKGDVLHQFRQDVQEGKLPTVSWLVAPENFSDHPGAPWYGAWYVSEAMDILTQNPEVWKKTIFILCYDENDGDFDHVPPFVPPNPYKPHSGLSSAGIDTRVEYVSLAQDMQHKPAHEARESSIGLGYRVPLLVASPWSRGGYVNSEVFDHTSILQFLENFIAHKSGSKIEETNISNWRRTICGDLSSVFKPGKKENSTTPVFLKKDQVMEDIHKAKFKEVPSGYRKLAQAEIDQINADPLSSPLLPKQEKGIRPSCALPYQLYADGQLSADKKTFEINFVAGNEVFGKSAAGAPFNVYAPGKYLAAAKEGDTQPAYEEVRTWAYACRAGDRLQDAWPILEFENSQYHLNVYGPNGFFRDFKGNAGDPAITVACAYEHSLTDRKKLTGNLEFKIGNTGSRSYTVHIKDNAYGTAAKTKRIGAAGSKDAAAVISLDLRKSFGWYDFTIQVEGAAGFEKRFAGRVETGKESFTDPAMGNV